MEKTGKGSQETHSRRVRFNELGADIPAKPRSLCLVLCGLLVLSTDIVER